MTRRNTSVVIDNCDPYRHCLAPLRRYEAAPEPWGRFQRMKSGCHKPVNPAVLWLKQRLGLLLALAIPRFVDVMALQRIPQPIDSNVAGSWVRFCQTLVCVREEAINATNHQAAL